MVGILFFSHIIVGNQYLILVNFYICECFINGNGLEVYINISQDLSYMSGSYECTSRGEQTVPSNSYFSLATRPEAKEAAFIIINNVNNKWKKIF